MARHTSQVILPNLPAAGSTIVEVPSPVTGFIEEVYVDAKAANANGDATFDVHLEGVTIFTDQTQRPKLLQNQTAGLRVLAAPVAVARGQWIQIDCDVLPSGGFGNKLVFEIVFSDTGSGTRSVGEATTPLLAAGATHEGTITLALTYAALVIELSHAARLRLYSTAAFRTADAARGIGTLPEGSPNEHGLMLEVITTADNLILLLAPAVIGYNGEDSASASIPYSLTNLSGASAVVTIAVTHVPLEN